MNNRIINYKILGPECEVYVRQRSPSRSEARLVANYRKQTKPSAGFLVDLDYTFPLNTLVEMDVKFPGQSFYYRSRGIVEWHGQGNAAERPYRLGIRVLGMEKLDPSGVPITPPKRKAAATTTSRHAATSVPMHMAGAPMETASPRAAENNAQARTAAAAAGSAALAAKAGATTLKLPKTRELSELLTSLIGEKVEVTKSTTGELDIDDMAVAGDYKTEEGDVLAVVATDIGLANWLGAGLAMIPKEVAKKDVEGSKMSDETRENTQEIFNINTSILNGPNLPHLRFGALYFCFGDEQPASVRTLMENPAARADFTVDVPGYGTGTMSYLLAEWHPKPAEAAVGTAETQFQMPAPQIAPDDSADIAAEAAAPAAAIESNTPKTPHYKTVLPKPREVAELLTNLVGEKVDVKKKEDGPLDIDDIVAVGDFISDDQTPLGLCAMDINLANWVAAALAMIPKDVVKRDIEGWKLSEESRDNVQEILNISASIFNKPSMPHLRFGALHVTLDGPLPAPVQALIDADEERIDFNVEIPGYGGGIISCIMKRL